MLERLDPRRSLLLVVDVQERLAAAMAPDALGRTTRNVGILLETSRILGAAVVATEQYPKGLGPTVASVAEHLTARAITPIAKTTFDALGEPAVGAALVKAAPLYVVVAGMEAHVCVYQTVRELLRRRLRVVVAMDAVASRTADNRAAGLALASRAGAALMPTETIVFDWLERAGTDEFRAVSKLVR